MAYEGENEYQRNGVQMRKRIFLEKWRTNEEMSVRTWRTIAKMSFRKWRTNEKTNIFREMAYK